METLYGCESNNCAAYCKLHKKCMTVKQIRQRNCLQKQCWHLERNEEYNGEPTYVYYNANPKGKRTDDCVIRAIAEAEGRTWEDVLRQLVEYSIRTGYMVTAVENYSLYFEEHGWKKMKQPVKRNRQKYRAYEFAKIYDGRCIAHVGTGHMSYLCDHSWYDIWNCTDGVVGNYWEYVGEKVD